MHYGKCGRGVFLPFSESFFFSSSSFHISSKAYSNSNSIWNGRTPVTFLPVRWFLGKKYSYNYMQNGRFYILCSMVYVQVAVVSNFSHGHQMFQASSIMDILLDMSAVHETTKSKMITKFTGLRNVVILLSRLFAL